MSDLTYITPEGEIKPLILRTAHNYDMNAATLESAVDCSCDAGKTMQQFADECDINEIVRKFGITGKLPDNMRMPSPADFSESINDFQTAMNAITEAQEMFLQVPAEIRARFDHDAGALMAWLHNPENTEEAIKLGFAVKKETPPKPEPLEVRVVADPPGPVAT